MGPRESRSVAATVITGVAGLAGIVLVLYLAGTAHTGLPWQSSTMVQAEFTDTDSLSEGNEVRRNSVRIGKVADIEYEDGIAVVTMRLDGDVDIYADATAEVWDFSVLAAKFVELSPGSPEAGELNGDRIAAEQTTDSADLYELFEVLDEPSREGATSAIRELGSGAAGRSRDLQHFVQSFPGLLADAGEISSALAADAADLPALLRSAERVASRFAGREEQIAGALEQTDATLRALAADGGEPLAESLQRLPGTLDSARTAFQELDAPLGDTQAAFDELRTGARALSESEEDLRGVLRESVEPFGKVPDVAEKATPAVGELSGTFADARPLAPQVRRALDDLETPMSVLAPYAPEMGTFFVRGHSWTSENVDGVHYARLGIASPVIRTVGGLLGPGAVEQEVYPEPGEADHHRAENLVGGVR
ncbi:MCE family protein [Haloechinothrix sp. YIM 98757]|uniref:MCE family protein n=1 Tax=Haloechinothrix aidingensis TaxID=2752311 RepID=A0A838AD98_9PSEU|nr:MlaD family protein [Haloechinothrix aidingensis]MBA0127200.1 MCE family protein [Haloechinothrix aidingensis]